MSEPTPTFASKWAFLLGHALIGFDPARQQFYSLLGEDGRPLLAMWTEADTARAALPDGFRLLQTDVRSRLAELPEGVGVAVDPDTPAGLVLAPEYAASLKPLTEPFPAGTHSAFKQWPLLPDALREALAAAAGRYAFVDRVWALIYNIDDSPWIGLLVYRTDGGEEAHESIVDALDGALSATASLEELAVPLVRIVSLGDLDPAVVAELEAQPPVFRR
ncbi:hypothetical protein [Nocardioides pantholopis]|uniref:hypothetical protein n=1 Tax=Nocardioides pantholopis TaxID=2483798 RepID=UPI000F07DE7D|nr:hypothetical protein [Nocardioides pantholopis]